MFDVSPSRWPDRRASPASLPAPRWSGQRTLRLTCFAKLSVPAQHSLFVEATAPEASVKDCRNFSVTPHVGDRYILKRTHAEEWGASPHGQNQMEARRGFIDEHPKHRRLRHDTTRFDFVAHRLSNRPPTFWTFVPRKPCQITFIHGIVRMTRRVEFWVLRCVRPACASVWQGSAGLLSDERVSSIVRSVRASQALSQAMASSCEIRVRAPALRTLRRPARISS